jgi:hypothetical protein
MLEPKTARIVKCVFTSEWQNPSGGITYYHELTMDNLDVGSIGKVSKYPKELSEGVTLIYTIDEKRKIKVISTSMDSQKSNSGYNNGSGSGKVGKSYNSGPKKQDEFLGYAWSYAKDLVVAGKTMKDVEELNKMARYIYEEIGKMLKNE